MRNYLPVQRHASKYGNIKTEYNGVKYDSKKEAEFAMTLDFSKKATKPSDRVVEWTAQVPYQVVLNGVKICKYIADFKVKYADGREVVYDVKPFDQRTQNFRGTDVFKLKKKLVEAQYGIEIVLA